MKFLNFVEREVDSFLLMQLLDLAKGLSKKEDLHIEFDLLSYYDPLQRTVYVSRFWDNEADEDCELGLKSDVYLCAFGHVHFSSSRTIHQALQTFQTSIIPSFARQLFTLCEELRLMDRCVSVRPGMKRAFDVRRKRYRRHYLEKLKPLVERKKYADALLCLIYLHLTTENELPDYPTDEALEQRFQLIEYDLFSVYETSTTDEVLSFCTDILNKLEASLLTKDCEEQFFKIIGYVHDEDGLSDTFDSLQRKDELKREASLEEDEEAEQSREGEEDKLPSWHGETSEPTQSFLQFDLEEGTNLNVGSGDAAREADSADQVYGAVQGQSRRSKRNLHEEQDLIKQADTPTKGRGHSAPPRYGEANRYARLIRKKPDAVTEQDRVRYEKILSEIKPYQLKLKRTIEKTVEHKKVAPRSSLHWGRLDRKLLKVVTEESPRLFYKKQESNRELDACFSLLVDCSSSMINKMEETKRGIVLFHETLSSLRIPHSVTGFWEDANRVKKEEQPNLFHDVIDFHRSLSLQVGAEILQLEPQEDNRDGFAIRITTEQLLKQQEKQRFLMIFSDGEPAAADYDENGILDTHQAVLEARRKGIFVIGVFLADGDISETEKNAMGSIYGRHYLIVNDVAQLVEYLSPLLKRLLLQQVVS